MNVSSSNFTNSMLSQMQVTPQKNQPSASELTSEIIDTSDIDSDGLLSIDELGISEDTFSNMDGDSDGSLSDSELESGLSAMLDEMKNQNTSPEEFGEMLSNMGLDVPTAPSQGQNTPDVSQMASEVFSSNDVDEDGLLSLDELGVSEDIFSSFDTDEDGSITQDELAEGLSALFDSVESGDMSKEEAGDILTDIGVPPPSGGPQGGGGGGGAASSDEDTDYDVADANLDGTVSSEEFAEYYGSDEDTMANYTMTLVSTLLDAIKTEQEENGSDDEIELSQFKQIMSMVNEQTQDPKTSDMLDKYISQI